LCPDKEAATPSAVGKISQQNPEETTVDISK
jgi:hypothetical protein